MLSLPTSKKICPYCGRTGIKSFSDCNCRKFKMYKRNISQNYYFSKILKINDESGFCSAGILPYFIDTDGTIFVLFLMQKRHNKDALNFAGGKRDSQLFSTLDENHSPHTIIVPETSIQTAKREFIEEVGELIHPDDRSLLDEVNCAKLDKVFWTGKNKMAIYLLEVKFNLCELKKHVDPEKTSEAIDLYVMPIQEMLIYKEIYHKWVFDILENMKTQCENDRQYYQTLKISFEF